MKTRVWLRPQTAKHARLGRQLFEGYAGFPVLNPTSATPQFPLGTIVEMERTLPSGTKRVTIEVSYHHS